MFSLPLVCYEGQAVSRLYRQNYELQIQKQQTPRCKRGTGADQKRKPPHKREVVSIFFLY